jgi:hypothetical protein
MRVRDALGGPVVSSKASGPNVDPGLKKAVGMVFRGSENRGHAGKSSTRYEHRRSLYRSGFAFPLLGLTGMAKSSTE